MLRRLLQGPGVARSLRRLVHVGPPHRCFRYPDILYGASSRVAHFPHMCTPSFPQLQAIRLYSQLLQDRESGHENVDSDEPESESSRRPPSGGGMFSAPNEPKPFGKLDYVFLIYLGLAAMLVLFFFRLQREMTPFQKEYIPIMTRMVEETDLVFRLAKKAFDSGFVALREKKIPDDSGDELNVHCNIESILESVFGTTDLSDLRYLNNNFVFSGHHRLTLLATGVPRHALKPDGSELGLFSKILSYLPKLPSFSYLESHFDFSFPVVNIKNGATAVLRVTFRTNRNPMTTANVIYIGGTEISEDDEDGESEGEVAPQKEENRYEISDEELEKEAENVSEAELEKYYEQISLEEGKTKRERMLEKRAREEEARGRPVYDGLSCEFESVSLVPANAFLEEPMLFYQMPLHLVDVEPVGSWPFSGFSEIVVAARERASARSLARLSAFVAPMPPIQGHLRATPEMHDSDLFPPYSEAWLREEGMSRNL